MRYHFCSSGPLLLIFIILVTMCLSNIEARTSIPLFGKKPAASKGTKATLTLNSFEKGGGGGGPSECDGKFHSDDTPIVALSSRWYEDGKRCFDFITIHGNGRSVMAKVVDECDSSRGCANDIVDGSRAVWKALGIKEGSRKWGEMKVTWSD